jgi:hypothetical protein
MKHNPLQGEESPTDIVGTAVPTGMISTRMQKPRLVVVRGGLSDKRRSKTKTSLAGTAPTRVPTTIVRGEDAVDIRKWAQLYLGTILANEGLNGGGSREFNYAS